MNLIEFVLISLKPVLVLYLRFGIIFKNFYLVFQKCKHYVFLSYILFELLDVEHGSPISHQNVKCNSRGIALAIDPPPPGGILYTMISRNNII